MTPALFCGIEELVFVKKLITELAMKNNFQIINFPIDIIIKVEKSLGFLFYCSSYHWIFN
jgi:hypothetical protein